MSTRIVDFVTGFTTSTAPNTSNPTNDEDAVNKGYADDTYARQDEWHDHVATFTAMRAIPSAGLINGTRLFYTGNNTEWYYNTSSSATDDNATVIKPTDNAGNGRWLQLTYSTGGGGGGGSASGVEALQQKLALEHYALVTDPLTNGVGSSFNKRTNAVYGVIKSNYTDPATKADVVWFPKYFFTADKNTDSTTGVTAVGDAGSLTTDSSNKTCGTASLKFSKAGAATDARLKFDHGAVDFSVLGNTELHFDIRFSTVTNLSDIEARINIDNTNYQTFTLNADNEGLAVSSFVANTFYKMKVDVATGGVASGAGWTVDQLFQYLEIGANWSSAAQTADVLIDAVHFSVSNPERYIQVGSVVDVYNNSDIVQLQIDEASANVSGTVDLAAALGVNFTGGDTSIAKRNSLDILADNRAAMVDGLSGDAADNQYQRIQRILPMSASADYAGFTTVNTNMFFEVTNVVSSSVIEVSDPSDSSSELINGKVLHVVRVSYNTEGEAVYSYRALDLTITSSSFSGGTTSITTGTNTGIAEGDIVVLKPLDVKISMVAETSNENFVTPTTDDILVPDLGLGFPFDPSVYAYYLIDADYTTNKKGTAKTLSTTGTFSTVTGFNGQYATSFDASSFLSLSYANSLLLAGGASDDEIILSLVFNIPGFTGSQRAIIGRQSTTGGGRGWTFNVNSSTNEMVMVFDSTAHTAGTFTPGVPNWLFASFKSGSQQVWLNGSSILSSTDVIQDDASSVFRIGNDASSQYLNAGSIYQVLLGLGNSGNAGIASSIYNRALGRILGNNPGFTYRWSQTGLSGQKITIENKLSRVTDIAKPFLVATGAIPS